MTKTHSRVPNTVLIPTTKLATPSDFRFDEQYQKKLDLIERGKIPLAFTRLDLASIESGSFVRVGGKVVHFSNLKPDYVKHLVAGIQAGRRPSIDVYWNPISPHAVKWVCPDDEVTLAAYRDLNIRWVPARVLNPRVFPAEHGAVWFKKTNFFRYEKAVAASDALKYAMLRTEASLGTDGYVGELADICIHVRSEVEKFSQHVEDAPHYHQMLQAVLSRQIDSLNSTDALINAGRYEHAAALVRMAYEAYLNLYIDWLSPEFLGPRIQLFSHLSISNGLSVPGTKADGYAKALTGLGGLEDLLANVSRKARISSLGRQFHEISYPLLSSIVHQSYAHVERDALSVGRSNHSSDSGLKTTLHKWLGIVTTALLQLIQNDIGNEMPVS